MTGPGYPGKDGDDGLSPTLSTGTITTVAAGGSATASITGGPSSYLVNIGIPRGGDGSPGANAVNPNITVSASGLSAGSTPTAVLTGTYPNLNIAFGIPAGAAGSSASATPLATVPPLAPGTAAVGVATKAAREDHVHPAQTVPVAATATPLAAGTAAVGTGTAYAREDHRHPLQAGTLTQVGNVTATETLLVSLSLGVRRLAVTLTGITTTDKLLFTPNGTPTAGCEAINVTATATNQITVSMILPVLGIGATYSVPISVWRIS